MPTPGHFSWHELITEDVEAAKRFYGAALGWSFRTEILPGGGEYVLIIANRNPIAGISSIPRSDSEARPEQWLSYIEVYDIDARVAAAEEHGGSIIRPPFDLPGVGRVAIVGDPSGAVVGWVTSYY